MDPPPDGDPVGRLAAVRAVARRWLALYVPVAATILGVSALVGFALGSAVPIDAFPMPTGTESGGVFPPLTTVDLAVNNLTAMLVMLLGTVSLGLMTVLALVVNGLLVGAIVGIAVQRLAPLVIVALIVPHGVLEIPALLVVSAVGLRFARLTTRYIRGLEDDLVTGRDLREAGWLVVVSAGLIIVAAYIEANLTIRFAEWVAGGEIPGIEA